MRDSSQPLPPPPQYQNAEGDDLSTDRCIQITQLVYRRTNQCLALAASIQGVDRSSIDNETLQGWIADEIVAKNVTVLLILRERP